jgi:signal transduction histidine kinase
LFVSGRVPRFAAEDTERAFGRFSRLDDARSRDGQEGAGLGLAIVRATTEAHGGSVTLGDAGPGLLATVRLPLAPGAVATSATT